MAFVKSETGSYTLGFVALSATAVIALIVLILVRVHLKRRLGSIDGLVGITTHGEYNGKVIGGEFTKVYPHQKEK